jgi:hypothetical protein
MTSFKIIQAFLILLHLHLKYHRKHKALPRDVWFPKHIICCFTFTKSHTMIHQCTWHSWPNSDKCNFPSILRSHMKRSYTNRASDFEQSGKTFRAGLIVLKTWYLPPCLHAHFVKFFKIQIEHSEKAIQETQTSSWKIRSNTFFTNMQIWSNGFFSLSS